MFSREEISRGPPNVMEFQEADRGLLTDLNTVFLKHGLEGSITRVEFDLGIPGGDLPPGPKPEPPRCFRICYPGPRDEPICVWICW